MQAHIISIRLRAVSAIFAAALFVTSAWAADHETVLHNFGNGNDGASGTSLIIDAAGNLYGVTPNGGIYQCGFESCGTVFQLSRTAGGGWTETVLHNFGNGTDGTGPNGLIMDAAGNLYGVTESGGLHGGGIVYELSPGEGGSWTETVLYNFSAGGGYGNGNYSLFRDAAGNLYGTMFDGGAYGEGMVFELSPSGGAWTETVLHSFGNGSDGQYPESGVVMDAAGNLYGTTYQGGTSSCGIVYELSPSESGGWTETVVHNFNGTDGRAIWASLILDAAGNLYGAAYQGGIYCPPFGCGTAFEFSPSEGGGWTMTVLHNFGNGNDGTGPLASLILDRAGNLYSTANGGGMNGYGAVFELSPEHGGGWVETVLYSFDRNDNGGYVPFASVVMDRTGDLYGNTAFGGLYGIGIAFELTPASIRFGSCCAPTK